MTHYEVIVLGGGTMGLAAAWELAKRGRRALVLEQFSLVHERGAHSGGSQGTVLSLHRRSASISCPSLSRATRNRTDSSASTGLLTPQ